MKPPLPRQARQALGLLGVMSLATVGGPLLILLVLRGGAQPEWPPDRPLEWWVFLGTIAVVAALMVVCVALALILQRGVGARRKDSDRAAG